MHKAAQSGNLLHQTVSSDREVPRPDMAQSPAASDADARSTQSGWMRMVPEEVVEVGRFDGTWAFKIEFQESAVPSSLLIRNGLDDHIALAASKSLHIVWDEQWMQDIPGDLRRDGVLELTRTLEAMIDANEDVVWFPESCSYTVGDNRRNHICLERACLDSKGTQCPTLAVGSISQQLAERVSANEEGRAERFKDAVEYLGKVVQDTYNSHPNDSSKMTASVLALASSDNPFRRLMRV